MRGCGRDHRHCAYNGDVRAEDPVEAFRQRFRRQGARASGIGSGAAMVHYAVILSRGTQAGITEETAGSSAESYANSKMLGGFANDAPRVYVRRSRSVRAGD